MQIGKTPCLVLETKNERIICRTEPRVPESEDVEDVIVFLKTSEESICGLGPGQWNFTWIYDAAQIGNIISFSPEDVAFNELTGFFEINIKGEGFTSNPNDIYFFIDGVR